MNLSLHPNIRQIGVVESLVEEIFKRYPSYECLPTQILDDNERDYKKTLSRSYDGWILGSIKINSKSKVKLATHFSTTLSYSVFKKVLKWEIIKNLNALLKGIYSSYIDINSQVLSDFRKKLEKLMNQNFYVLDFCETFKTQLIHLSKRFVQFLLFRIDRKFVLLKFLKLKLNNDIDYLVNVRFDNVIAGKKFSFSIDRRSLMGFFEEIKPSIENKGSLLVKPFVTQKITTIYEIGDIKFSCFFSVESKYGKRIEKILDVAKNKFVIFFSLLFVFFIFPALKDRLTPPDKLAIILYERSKYEYDGAVCNDGSRSSSQGRGTCSWHNGVNYYFFKGSYSKSFNQCKIEAYRISWIDNF